MVVILARGAQLGHSEETGVFGCDDGREGGWSGRRSVDVPRRHGPQCVGPPWHQRRRLLVTAYKAPLRPPLSYLKNIKNIKNIKNVAFLSLSAAGPLAHGLC